MTAVPDLDLDLDPYVLPLPTGDSPVVTGKLVAALHAHLDARYTDAIWPLAPLTENPSAGKAAIHWDDCPDPFQDEVRLAAWTMINGTLRPTFLKARSTKLRSRLGLIGLRDTVVEWIRLATWLAARDIHTLSGCGSGVLHDYGMHLSDSGRGREITRFTLGALTRLWAFDQLSARPTGIGRPPWDELGADDYLPAATSTSGGENLTEVLSSETIGPLLTWAIRLVDDFADDILAAWWETQRLTAAARSNPASQAGKEALRAYLMPLIATGAALPTTTNGGRVSLARTYIGGMTGASKGHIETISKREGLPELASQRPGPCPLSTAVTGQIGGRPWRQSVEFTEAADLMRHLGTACFIVIAYLTGMRAGEKRAKLHRLQHSSRPNTGESAGQAVVCEQLAA